MRVSTTVRVLHQGEQLRAVRMPTLILFGCAGVGSFCGLYFRDTLALLCARNRDAMGIISRCFPPGVVRVLYTPLAVPPPGMCVVLYACGSPFLLSNLFPPSLLFQLPLL